MSASSSPASSASPEARVEALRDQINAALPTLVEGKTPEDLYAPVAYVLESGGKRLRPVLLLLVAQAFGASTQRALPAALAVEVFHNFTLVHDDIMDAAEARRGRPTVHVRWDTNTAILAGDLMMGLSYRLLSDLDEVDHSAVFDAYHPMVEELCRGQALDASFETCDDVSVEAYLDMVSGKTGALLAAVFELGALVGGASESAQRTLHEAGLDLGRAFQVQDDLLDVVADDEAWGKAVGGDLVVGKRTFLTLRALERATGKEYAWFARLLDGGLPPEDVPEARTRMDRLGVLEAAREAVSRYTAAARDALAVLPDAPATVAIHWLVDRMEHRSH
jgi:geranylgeranyl diphosphate synthase type II